MKPILFFIIFSWQFLAGPQKLLLTKEGTIHFKSEATVELIEATSKKLKDVIPVSFDFTIPLANHNITIPEIVNQKIAEENSVDLNVVLQPQS